MTYIIDDIIGGLFSFIVNGILGPLFWWIWNGINSSFINFLVPISINLIPLFSLLYTLILPGAGFFSLTSYNAKADRVYNKRTKQFSNTGIHVITLVILIIIGGILITVIQPSIDQFLSNFLADIQYNFLVVLIFDLFNIFVPILIIFGSVAHNNGGIKRTLRSF